MNNQSNTLMKKLGNLFGKSEYSDCTVNIIEINKHAPRPSGRKTYPTRRQSSVKTKPAEVLFCSIPVHRSILATQCEYFKKMCDWSQNESSTNTFDLKVDEGDGQYVKLFIQAFYNHEIFRSMSLTNLLRTIEIADQYSCDAVIRQAAISLSDVVKSLDLQEAIFVSKRISDMFYGLEIMKQAIKKISRACGVFATKYFCPLETTMKVEDERFKNLPFPLLLEMLRCKEPLAYHENSLFFYLLAWLEYDISRQQPWMIKLILQSIDYLRLTARFLVDVVTPENSVLNKCGEFDKWFRFVIEYHALSSTRPRPFKLASNFYRNFSEKNKVRTVKFHLTKSGDTYSTAESFVYNGYHIIPGIIFREAEATVMYLYLQLQVLNVKEYIANSGEYFEIMNVNLLVAIDRVIDDVDFHGVSRSHSTSCVAEYHINDSGKQNCVSIGEMEKACIDNWDTIDMMLAFKNDRGEWPKSFPSHLRLEEWTDVDISYDSDTY